MKKRTFAVMLFAAFVVGLLAQPLLDAAVISAAAETIPSGQDAYKTTVALQETEETEQDLLVEQTEILQSEAAQSIAPVTSAGIQETLVNVKSFGAVGDGKTDDRAAIERAMNYAAANLPATVYFPQGVYGLGSGGIYLNLPLGAGGLTIMGDGGDVSVIKYLDGWTPAGKWVAIRVQPAAVPKNLSEYIHDVTITELGVFDSDPVGHAWTEEENGAKEETHGFDIQYCVRATVENCLIRDVGDEAIDMVYCIDSLISNNTTINCPAAGAAGGAISAGDGCKNIRIVSNAVQGSIGTKENFGIAVEALIDPVENIIISSNTITDIHGYGINIGAPRGRINGVVVDGCLMDHCVYGIRLMGAGKKENITLTDTVIKNVDKGIVLEGGNTNNVLLDGFTVDQIGKCAIYISTTTVYNTIISNGIITNSKETAIYSAGTATKIDNVLINGVGLSGGIKTAAILQYTAGGSCEVNKVTIKNCKNSKAIQAVESVIDTIIEQDEVAGYASITGAKVIRGGKVNRLIQGLKDGAVLDGLEIVATKDLGLHAIYLNGISNCIITNCRIIIPSRYAVKENGSADNNMIINNYTNKSIGIVGDHTVRDGNLTLS